RDPHFLTRIADRPPAPPRPEDATSYLALLDQALLDHHISVAESDALVRLASALGRAEAERLHLGYLTALARTVLAGGPAAEDDRHELALVAVLLGLPAEAADRALAGDPASPPPDFTRFRLSPGDLVVFTGEMDGPRDDWEWRARQAGYVPHGYITRKVRLLVAADPDSLSAKARKARDYGIPIVTPDAFARMLG
ncbi:BRCT domain-containing protein, partial [Streptosporangium canum]|uniref:BRCT domain-containing protein n=1 Tax=Streptosporangium canum TaxID=324952 RepID=UPI00342B555E